MIGLHTMALAAITLLLTAGIAEAQRGNRQNAPQAARADIKPVLIRDDNARDREWVVRVEASAKFSPIRLATGGPPTDQERLYGNLTPESRDDLPGNNAKEVSLAYPLPMSFGWGGTRPETIWARLELAESRTSESFYLEPIDDGTTNLVFEMPRHDFTARGFVKFNINGGNPGDINIPILPITLRMMFVVQSHGISGIDESRAIEQYAWPGAYPPSIARYLEPEPFIESDDARVRAFLNRVTRGRSPKSVPPYQLAKHLASEVLHYGTPRGAYQQILIYLRRSIANDNWRDPPEWIIRILWPEVPFNHIGELGRRIPGTIEQQTQLRGRFPGVTAPPDPLFFPMSREGALPAGLNARTHCFPGPGFPIQSAADAVLGNNVTDEGMVNLLIALYRAAGIPARLTLVIDQHEVLEMSTNQLEPQRRSPTARRTTAPPTNAIFRPVIEFWLTAEDGQIGEWIPVDIARQRTETNPAPPLNTAWEHFGKLRRGETMVAVAHHWVAPGHAFAERPHLWGIWPSLPGFWGNCGQYAPHTTCIWAGERANTGELPQNRERLIPELSPR